MKIHKKDIDEIINYKTTNIPMITKDIDDDFTIKVKMHNFLMGYESIPLLK